MVPIAAEQPTAARRLLVELAQSFAELGFVLRILQRDLAQPKPGAEQVDVRIVEAGDDELALQVDNTSVGANECVWLYTSVHA